MKIHGYIYAHRIWPRLLYWANRAKKKWHNQTYSKRRTNVILTDYFYLKLRNSSRGVVEKVTKTYDILNFFASRWCNSTGWVLFCHSNIVFYILQILRSSLLKNEGEPFGNVSKISVRGHIPGKCTTWGICCFNVAQAAAAFSLSVFPQDLADA